MMRRLATVWICACAPVGAQEAPDSASLIAAVKANLRADAEQLDAAVQAIAAEPTSLSAHEYLTTALLLFRYQRPEACVALCEAGIGAYDKPRGLHDFVAMSHLTLAEDADTGFEVRDHAAAAVRAFQTARDLDTATMHNPLYLHRALMLNCEFDRALKEYDEAMEDADVASKLPVSPHAIRGMMLLCAGRYEDAARELAHESLSADERDGFATMRIRARALSGDTERAKAEARERWRAQPTPEATAILADVLAIAGAPEDARKLLRDHPSGAAEQDDADRIALEQGRATFDYLIELGDERPDDLRGRLAQLLGHRFEVMGAKDSTAALEHSPVALGFVLRRAPLSLKDWANHLMFAVCAADRPGYEPSELETTILNALGDEGLEPALQDRERALAIVRGSLMMHEDGGVMLAVRLAEKL